MKSARRITLGILAHVDAGKTTLSEAMLYRTGEIRTPGRVDHGDAFLDDSEIERNRGITIFSKQARFTIRNSAAAGTGKHGDAAEAKAEIETETNLEVTLIDTPGHVDFAAEMERALSVIDCALLVISGSEGVQAHTRTLYRMLSERGIPVFVFVNKMDIAVRPKEEILSDLAEELGCGAVDFSSVTGSFELSESFIDAVTLYSPELAEKVLERELECEGSGDNPDSPVLSDHEIAESVRRCEIVPCMFGSALRIEGVDELLEVLERFAPVPEYDNDNKHAGNAENAENGGTFAAKVYKIANAEDGSRLTFAKITGGSLKVRDTVDGHKITQIRLYSGSRFTTVESVEAGMVAALMGLPDALPGDALGAAEPETDADIKAFMVYTVTGPEEMDPYLLMKDLEKLAQEDPALGVRWRPGTGEIEIRLMGQVQLEVLTAMINDRFGYEVTFGEGKVLYLETVSDVFEGVGHFEPLRHYAEVHLLIEPGEPGSGIVISSITPEDELARNWQRLILTHIDEKEHVGVLTGSPLTDVRITLAAGRAHDKHTSGGDFREATYRAVRNALMQARAAGAAVLLEPWLEYEIELPSQAVGRAMTDIRLMGGTQDALEQNGDVSGISGRVPASEITGYQQVLTGYTSGLGRLSCTPAGYSPCHDAAKVIEESGYEPERDVENTADSVFVSHGATDIIKWDEVPEHMHIGSVLRKIRESGSGNSSASGMGFGAGSGTGSGSGILSSEERDRKAAAEKELRMIFERTYGPVKSSLRREARESKYGGSTDMDMRTPEQKAADESRNQEIREKHERRKIQKTGGYGQERQERQLLLIDGYNLIHSDEYLKELASADMGAARDQILERLSNFAAYTDSEVCVIFDAYNVAGGEGYEEDVLGLRVIYTAEDEPADIRIGIMTGAAKNRRIYVVSSDVLVQQDSFEHGALRISSREFMRMLAETEEEIRAAVTFS